MLKAMHFRIPIVAYASTAIPETLADAAVLLDDKDPVVVAATVDEVLARGDLRKLLDEHAAKRLEDLSPARSWQRFESLLMEVLN